MSDMFVFENLVYLSFFFSRLLIGNRKMEYRSGTSGTANRVSVGTRKKQLAACITRVGVIHTRQFETPSMYSDQVERSSASLNLLYSPWSPSPGRTSSAL